MHIYFLLFKKKKNIKEFKNNTNSGIEEEKDNNDF